MTTVVDLIEATVKVEQPLGNGQRTIGTGFIVTRTTPDGTPRAILITANHVLTAMPHQRVTVGFRMRDELGSWRYSPLSVQIREADGRPHWTNHPTQDVAVLELPATIIHGAVPSTELPGERALETLGVQPGDEMMVLGYPRGLSANSQGFPILSAGRVASYPLSPADKYPTYLVNMNVHAGNSGSPVYLVLPRPAEGASARVVVTGLLTQQIKYNGDRLAIGNVTQADFISETISLMDSTSVVGKSSERVDALKDHAVSVGHQQFTWRAWWSTVIDELRIFALRIWISLRDRFNNWITPDATPSTYLNHER